MLEAVQGAAVRPNHVYVIPPNATIAITDGILQIIPRQSSGPHLPINYFLRSLAEDRREAAIGVILSGSGTDGTQGLEEIKAAGGITFAQTEETAKCSGMPESAARSGCVDLVLSPRQIAQELVRMARHPYLIQDQALKQNQEEIAAAEDEDYRKIMALLHHASGVDFSFYRDSTIKRRIMRRLALNTKKDLADYTRFLENNPAEAEALYNDILIQVTSFFRDPDVFKVLQTSIFPEILKTKQADLPIRIWVPGCSSGQEAYSLAIALLEFLERDNKPRAIQIFATDLSDSGALQKAREGLYPDSIEAELSPERLRRFFTKENGKYRIIKQIRDMCAFAKHNVAADPPFSRMDLISCRNLLIYLALPLQRRVIPTFHYALNPGGFLLLGSAETVGIFTDLFEPADQKHRIYTKKAIPIRQYPHFSANGLNPRALNSRSNPTPASAAVQDWQREADRVLIGAYAPAGVLVNSNLDILQFRGRTAPYLEPAPGEPSHNLTRMACEGLLPALQRAIAECAKSKAIVEKHNVRLRRNEEIREVSIRVLPVSLPGQAENCFLILFEEKELAEKAPVPSGDESEIDRLRHDLASAHEYIQSAIEQKDAANEELRSANEEILSSNEEFQSTNEELETAKEELQSVNEELTTVNEQLQYRNQELNRLNKGLQESYEYTKAIVETVREPLIVLNSDFRAQTANQAFYKTFHMTPKETEGCLLYDLENGQWDIPELRRLLEDLLYKKTVLEDYEVNHVFKDTGTRIMLLNARRIVSQDNPDLILLAIEDITERRRLEKELKKYTDNLREADHRKDEFLAILAHELRNPLAPISNALQTLESAEADPELTRQAHEIMMRQVRQMVRLIDDLLDVSRIANGTIELNLESVNLATIVADAVETIGPLIDAAGQKLTVSLPPELLWLKADAARLTQVLGNLLNNAAKYTKENGHIWLTAKRDGNEALIEVRDTGIGIPAHMLERIFDMFSQVDTSLERSQGGLGIGLMLVKNMISMHGGTITAVSAGPGQGSKFIVRLPLASERGQDRKASSQDNARPLPDKAPRRRILVVDDNIPSAKTMGWMVAGMGHDVRLAHNGADAISRAKDFLPDMVLLDIGLPEMNGYDVCRAMRQEPMLKNIMIVAQTGWGQKEHRERSKQAGFDYHLVKPVARETIKEILDALKGGIHNGV